MHDVQFQIKPSMYYFSLVSLVIFVCIVVISLLNCSIGLKLSLLLGTGSYGAYLFWGFVLLKGKRSMIGLKYLSKAQKWQIVTTSASYEADVCHHRIVTPQIIFLKFNVSGMRFAQRSVIFCDSLLKDDYRKLFVL